QKQLLVSDIPLSQSMAAVRHANGRDWWIVFPRFMTIYDHPIFQAYEHPDSVTHLDNLWNFVNTHPEQFLDTLGFVRYLFTPTGVEGPFEEQIIGGLWWPGQIRTAEFSPDGSKYVLGAPFSGLQLFDFDRCTGLFSNPITIDGYSGIIAGRGMAIFSPDSKYLYLHDSQKLYQRSLSEPITETLLGDMSNPPFYVGGNHWFNPMNGPDGKLYLAAGDTNTMHRIEFPNRPGADCQVKRHVIKLPTRYVMRSRFNFANYRLGPIDGSSCDSLGIDNVPLANFRYDLEDTLQPLQLTFTDVTDYEPSTWQWFFGDGQSSNEQNPVHVYAHSGTYQVCLTASNANGSSTFCRTVGIGLVGTENPAWEELIQAYPNPVSEQWTILINGVDHPVKMTLSDCTGRYIATHSLTVGINDLNINDLKPGVYFWEVRDKNVGLKKGKVVKI
ncbi:MAG: PKD domain-containing protein, partial [Saprospiraceae bacterium]|nr:PKD domain-containing protein [Saprospiraceae bacterium]